QARQLVETDPTAAVAQLKQLESPDRWDRLWRNARDIAAGARSAGVAWGVPGPEMAIALDLSPNGTLAVVTGRDGAIELVDRRARTTRSLGVFHDGLASFGDDDLVAVAVGDSIHVIDLRSGDRHDIPVSPAVRHHLVASRGRAFAVDRENHLKHIELRTGA